MSEKRKPIKKAAAIQYNPDVDAVPVLTAYGEGHVADKILEKAEEAGVPVLPDAPLAGMLSKMSVGDEIPPALYEAVAKVLLFISEMDTRYGQRVKDAAHSRRRG